jgi:2-dehydro-3-deoxyphosphogluconate aldolase/(4S)-4-hydroxy-2-oxoglutarate aldolase
MARLLRLDVLNSIISSGLVPLFYHHDYEVACAVADGIAEGGCKLLEFTNRGEAALPVFVELVKYLEKKHPQMVVGVGSVIDAPTAALYIAQGANFVVGPTLNPDVARLCNRRKIAYIPGCATPSEISNAEEWGAEICKIFPGDTLGGPAFIKAILGPMPWARLMPSGGVEASQQNIAAWFGAGAAVVGMGGNLVRKEWLSAKDYASISRMTGEVLGWIKACRNPAR